MSTNRWRPEAQDAKHVKWASVIGVGESSIQEELHTGDTGTLKCLGRGLNLHDRSLGQVDDRVVDQWADEGIVGGVVERKLDATTTSSKKDLSLGLDGKEESKKGLKSVHRVLCKRIVTVGCEKGVCEV